MYVFPWYSLVPGICISIRSIRIDQIKVQMHFYWINPQIDQIILQVYQINLQIDQINLQIDQIIPAD